MRLLRQNTHTIQNTNTTAFGSLLQKLSCSLKKPTDLCPCFDCRTGSSARYPRGPGGPVAKAELRSARHGHQSQEVCHGAEHQDGSHETDPGPSATGRPGATTGKKSAQLEPTPN